MVIVKRKCLTQATLEGITKILGDTSNGLTGSEIQYLLQQSQIEDIDSQNTRWKRLYSAFANYQNTYQCSNKILYFIQLALSPAKFVNNEYEFTEKRNAINQQLAFIGYQIVFRVCRVLGKKHLAPGGRREDFFAKPERLDLAKS